MLVLINSQIKKKKLPVLAKQLIKENVCQGKNPKVINLNNGIYIYVFIINTEMFDFDYI